MYKRQILEPEDRLNISLLIPNLQPENEQPEKKLPRLFLYRPDGSVLEGTSDLYVPFDEPFSMTRYIRIFDHTEQSLGGLHKVKIVGSHPSRFTASIGYIESFGTPVENVPNREAGRTGISDWYQNPVPENPLEIPEEETVAPIAEESTVEKPDTTLVETLETSEEEIVASVIEKAKPEISESTSSSSSKIYIPIVTGSLFLLFSAGVIRRKKSSNQANDQ